MPGTQSAQYISVEWISDYVNAENVRKRVICNRETVRLLWPFLNEVTSGFGQTTMRHA